MKRTVVMFVACLAVMVGMAYAGAIQYNDEQGYDYNGPVTFKDTVTQTGTTDLTGATVTMHLTNTTIRGATSGQILVGSGTDLVPVTASGLATISSGGVITGVANQVTTSLINTSAVTPAKLLNGTDAQIYISTPTQVLFKSMSGAATLSNAGVLTLGTNVVTAGKFYTNGVSMVIAAGTVVNTSATLPTGYTGLNAYVSSQTENAYVNSITFGASSATVTLNGTAAGDVNVRFIILMP